MMMGRVIMVACAIGATASAPAAGEDVFGKFPPTAKEVLAAAEAVEVLSLDPDAGRADPRPGEAVRFHEWMVLGSTTVNGRDAVARLVGRVEGAVTEATVLDEALCFRPRHGLRARAKDTVVELVICYECRQLNVYVDGRFRKHCPTKPAPAEALDAVLTQAKVPLPAGPKDKR